MPVYPLLACKVTLYGAEDTAYADVHKMGPTAVTPAELAVLEMLHPDAVSDVAYTGGTVEMDQRQLWDEIQERYGRTNDEVAQSIRMLFPAGRLPQTAPEGTEGNPPGASNVTAAEEKADADQAAAAARKARLREAYERITGKKDGQFKSEDLLVEAIADATAAQAQETEAA